MKKLMVTLGLTILTANAFAAKSSPCSYLVKEQREQNPGNYSQYVDDNREILDHCASGNAQDEKTALAILTKSASPIPMQITVKMKGDNSPKIIKLLTPKLKRSQYERANALSDPLIQSELRSKGVDPYKVSSFKAAILWNVPLASQAPAAENTAVAPAPSH